MEAYYREARLNRECACEDLNFWWDSSEFKEMIKMWERGSSVERIAAHFDSRDPDEVLIALIHLAREDKIEQRRRGLKGES